MCEPQIPWTAAQGRIDVDLDAGVGHVILAPHHMGDAAGQVIHDRGEGIKRRAVFPDQHRIRHGAKFYAAGAEHHVPPIRWEAAQQETPVRALAPRFRLGPLLGRELQHGAVIQWRLVAFDTHFSLGRQFLLAFEAGVEPSACLQSVGRRLVLRHPVRLPERFVPMQAEPVQVMADRLLVFRLAAPGIGVVDPEQEVAAMPPGQQVVGQRHPRVARMQQARGARREAQPHASSSSGTCSRGSIVRQSRSAIAARRAAKSASSVALFQAASPPSSTCASSP